MRPSVRDQLDGPELAHQLEKLPSTIEWAKWNSASGLPSPKHPDRRNKSIVSCKLTIEDLVKYVTSKFVCSIRSTRNELLAEESRQPTTDKLVRELDYATDRRPDKDMQPVRAYGRLRMDALESWRSHLNGSKVQ
jgi:hypothetical protein